MVSFVVGWGLWGVLLGVFIFLTGGGGGGGGIVACGCGGFFLRSLGAVGGSGDSVVTWGVVVAGGSVGTASLRGFGFFVGWVVFLACGVVVVFGEFGAWAGDRICWVVGMGGVGGRTDGAAFDVGVFGRVDLVGGLGGG